MASESHRGLSSAFDDLLKANRDQLDSRMRGVWSTRSATAEADYSGPADQLPPVANPPPVISQRPVAPSGSPLRQEGEYHSASQVWDAAKSEVAQGLNERFGTAWEYSVVKRHREGDEYIVMGKLAVPAKGISKTQFGRGRIPREGAAHSGVRGSAGGITFSLGDSRGDAGSSQSPEERGYRRAIEDALANCAALL